MNLIVTLKALADESRLRLVAVLSRGEFTVQELTAILALGQSRVSHHLKALTGASILSVKRQGTWAYYRLDESSTFFSELRPLLAQRFDEIPGHSADLVRLAKVLDVRQRKSREFFDRHALQWDAMAGTVLPMVEIRPLLLDVIQPCAMLVEVGVGTGSLLSTLSQRAASLIGIDHSPAMIELARQRVAELGLANVELRLGEMSHLPVGNGQAETVILNMVLHHAPDPAGVFLEISRVLAPAGVLVIADLVRHEQEWVRDELADQWLGFERSELEGWLKSAGFSITTFQVVTGDAEKQSVFILQATQLK